MLHAFERGDRSPSRPAVLARGLEGGVALGVEPAMMRQVRAAKELAQPEHQQQAVEKAQDAQIRAVARERNAVNVLVQQHADAVLENCAGQECQREGRPQQQGHQQHAQYQEAAVGQQRRKPAVEKPTPLHGGRGPTGLQMTGGTHTRRSASTTSRNCSTGGSPIKLI